MKNYILFLLFLMLFNSLVAQDDPNCGKENVPISTDWRRYVPNDPNFPNNWDWTTQPTTGYPVYLTNNQINPSFYIDLPYKCRNVQGQGSCGQVNALHYEILEAEGKKQDIYPEDGWELLIKNFGTPTIGLQSGTKVENPFYILYNRINGKMRIFYAIVGKKSGSSIVLKIAFASKSATRRAVFAHVRPIAQTLQEFGASNQYQILNHYAQGSNDESYYWLVGDIITSYDPCTCNYSDAGSGQIEVTPVLATVSDIVAEIEGQLTQRVASSGQVQGATDGQLSYQEIGDIAGKAIAKGQKSYNEFEKHRKEILNFITKRNDEYAKRLGEWSARQKDENGNFIWDGYLYSQEVFDDHFGLKPVEKYGRLFNGIKTIAPAIPYIGAAWGLVEFFMNGGAKKTTPTATPPVVTDVALKLVGKITTTIPQTSFSFNLPGSAPNSNSGLSPLYNRTLGVFNILKPPAMEYFDLKVNDISIINRVFSDNGCIDGLDEFGSGYYMAQSQSPRQFRLKEDVKYLVNPMASLEVDMIDACFVVEYDNTQKLFMESPTKYNETPALPLYNFVTLPNNPTNPAVTSWENRVKWIEESGWDLEYVSEGYPKKEGSFIRFRTKYMPLQCLKNLNFILWGGQTPKIYLKMAIKAKRTDIQNAEEVMQVVMYNVANSYNKATLNNTLQGGVELHLNAKNITHDNYCCFMCGQLIPTYSKYDDFDYTINSGESGVGFHIRSLALQNPYYTYPNMVTLQGATNVYGINAPLPPLTNNITVQNDIIIGDNIVVADGVVLKSGRKIVVGKNVKFGKNVELIAGYSIDVSKETEINMNNVTLKIDNLLFNPLALFNCNDNDIKKLKASVSEIYGRSGICSNKVYMDSVLTKPFVQTDKNLQKATQLTTDLNAFPNPFTNFLKITFNIEEHENVRVSVINGMGQIIKNTTVNNDNIAKNYTINISTEGWSTGVYFITTYSTQNGIKTQKVLKTN